jgi:hypothetical protein
MSQNRPFLTAECRVEIEMVIRKRTCLVFLNSLSQDTPNLLTFSPFVAALPPPPHQPVGLSLPLLGQGAASGPTGRAQ